MTLILAGTALLVIAGLLRLGLASLEQMDLPSVARAAAEGVTRAERHLRLLGRDGLMILAGWRVEGVTTILAVVLLTAGIAATGEEGWAALWAVMITTASRIAAGALGRLWRGAERMSGLVEGAALLHSRLWRPRWALDSEEAEPENGELSEESEMISSVLEFSETIVREVMVPRPDMVTVQVNGTLDELAEIVKEYGFSRFPVLDGGIDRVVGLALAKDLLPALAEGESAATVAEIQRTPLYVPETKPVSDLLREMRRHGAHMAVVIDEHGGTAGLVTIEDLLEELVGEIVDEHDEEDEWLRVEEGGALFVDGRFPVDDLGDLLGVPLPQEEWDTVGGLVLALAGRVPAVGEVLSTEGVEFLVKEVLGHRVSEVRVRRSGGGLRAAAVG